MKKNLNIYLPQIVYGGLDGIVTTFAVVVGSISTGVSIKTTLILGCCNLIADAISMSAGAYTSEDVRKENKNKPTQAALWTGSAFILFGSVPLLPVLFSLVTTTNLNQWSVFVFTGISLITLGAYKAQVEEKSPVSSIIQTLVIGTLVAIAAWVIGDVLSRWLSTI